MVMGNSKGLMEDIIKVNGLMIYMMEKDYMYFHQVKDIVVILNQERGMDMENIHIMEMDILENGKMDLDTEKDICQLKAK